LSSFLYNSTSFMLKVIDTILKSNIRIHGGENIDKKSPTLFVANHFTRFETLIMPFAINRETGQKTRSLAHESIFIGLLANYLENVGTLSTADKDRNEIIIGDLMVGKDNWLIYPEGMMVKNKHITKENEFMLHTPERSGPVHTGAAVMALASQMLKNELRTAMKEGNIKRVEEIKSTYFLEDKELSYHSTVIVPVNISYTPIRPGSNAMMKMVSLFSGDKELPNIMEELEIEGNILSNAQVHIYFDKPIDMASYIHHAKQDMQISKIEDKKIQHEEIVKKFRKQLTTIFMDSIYKNVLLNFDHIFIATLKHCTHTNITKQQLRRYMFLVAGDIEALDVFRMHDSVRQEILQILTKDKHTLFEEVLRLAIEQKILTRIKSGYYIINPQVLTDDYSFHRIRIKNTLKVIYNEIAMLDTLQDSIKTTMSKKHSEIVEEILYRLYRRDLEIFKKDYSKFYSVIGSKPKEIGSPFLLYKPEYTTGIVFSHGYNSAPQEIRALGEYVHAQGYNFYGVRLKGHGTMPEDLRDTKYEQWYESFNLGYAALRQVSKRIFIGGFSTGGLIALLAASRKLEQVDGVLCINSAIKLHDIRVRYVVPTVDAVNDFLAIFNANIEYVENNAENPHINYAKNYLKSIVQLRSLMELSFNGLESIIAPTLVIQGDDDPVVDPKSGSLIMEHIKSEHKELFTPHSTRHVSIIGDGSEDIFKKVVEFIKKVEENTPKRRDNDK